MPAGKSLLPVLPPPLAVEPPELLLLPAEPMTIALPPVASDGLLLLLQPAALTTAPNAESPITNLIADFMFQP